MVYVIDSLVPGGAETSLSSMLSHLRFKNVKLECSLPTRPSRHQGGSGEGGNQRGFALL